MKKLITTFIFIFSISLFSIGKVEAHPGRTDSSGGHTCRTNCPSWGLDYGEYHYHNGGYTTPYTTPYNTPYSTPYTTPIITSPKPTPKPSPTPTPSPSPSPTPEVKGETTEISPIPSPDKPPPKTGTAGDAVLGFGILAAIIAGLYWLTRSVIKKFKHHDEA